MTGLESRMYDWSVIDNVGEESLDLHGRRIYSRQTSLRPPSISPILPIPPCCRRTPTSVTSLPRLPDARQRVTGRDYNDSRVAV